MPEYEVPLTLEQINAVIKSIGITLDVTANKLPKVDPESKYGKRLSDEYGTLLGAQEALRDVQQDVLVG